MKYLYTLLVFCLLLVLTACAIKNTPEQEVANAAINERLALTIEPNNANVSLASISKEGLSYEVTPGYEVNIIDTIDGNIIFDLIIDKKKNIRLNDYADITFKTKDGDVVAKQRYKLAAILANSELVLNLGKLSRQELEKTLKNSQFTPATSIDDELMRVDIGKQSSGDALKNMLELLDANPKILAQNNPREAKIVAGYNFAYKLNPYTVRSLDPSCSKQLILTDYMKSGWQKISNLIEAEKVTAAHGAGFKGNDIVVVLLDSGIDEQDDFDCDNTPDIKEGHGTHIRDIIKTLAPEVTIVSKKVFSHSGNASIDTLVHTSDILQSLKEVEKDYLTKGKKVIVNMSFSSPSHPDYGPDLMLWGALNQYYKRYANSLLFVASAGNHGFDEEHQNEYFYPAGFMHNFKVIEGSVIKEYPAIPNIVSVGSAGLINNKIQAAEYNPNVGFDIFAYGVNICSQPNCKPRALVGSSFSAPIITALSALIWDQCEDFNSTETIKMLKKNTLVVPNKLQGLAISKINHNCQFRNSPSALAVFPESGFTASGIQTEKNFSPSEQCFTLKNVGAKSLAFRVDETYWLDSSLHIVRLDPQTTARICVSLSQQQVSELSLGVHKAEVVFKNTEDETDFVKRQITVIVRPFVSLRVKPLAGFTAVGTSGKEDFEPKEKCYTLTNKGPKPIDYDIEIKDSSKWLINPSINKTLNPSETKEVCFKINQREASKKGTGAYVETVTFINDSNPVDNQIEIDFNLLVR